MINLILQSNINYIINIILNDNRSTDNKDMKILLTSPLAIKSSIASTASLNAPDLLDFTKVSLYSR